MRVIVEGGQPLPPVARGAWRVLSSMRRARAPGRV